MKHGIRLVGTVLAAGLLLFGTATAENGFTWDAWTGGINSCTVEGTELVIPAVVDGHDSIRLGDGVICDNAMLTSITVE